MGVGTARLNAYTIQRISQGLANYINLQEKRKEHHRVLIGFDNRKNSKFFAENCAYTLAANGIEVFLLKHLRPTPLISFGCIYYHCKAAVMITASHNPPEYNGYKVYWEDGAQVLPPHDKGIIAEVERIKEPNQIKLTTLKNPLIQLIGTKLDNIYIQTTKSLQNYPELTKKKGSSLKIIYTNLHGTGITLAPATLKEWGFTSLHVVEKQKKTDGSFPYAPIPNPEEKEALQLGVKDLIAKKGDILLATDPDADRVGVVIRKNKTAIAFTGNQMACLLLYHLLQGRKNLPEISACIKTIVTTELFKEIAQKYGKRCEEVLTGFKYIAEKIRAWEKTEEYHFILGAEESYGYLAGTFVRDKDAITASCLIAELALLCKTKNMTLYDLLLHLYQEFGIFREKLVTISFPESKEGMQKMQEAMSALRKNPPSHFLEKKVVVIEDYLKSHRLEIDTKKTTPLSLPKSDVLLFWLEDKTKIVIRPSGTEPKIKIYLGGENKHFTSVKAGIKKTDSYLDQLGLFLENSFNEKL